MITKKFNYQITLPRRSSRSLMGKMLKNKIDLKLVELFLRTKLNRDHLLLNSKIFNLQTSTKKQIKFQPIFVP